MKLRLPSNPVKNYIVQVALWLPLIFLLWFYFASILTWPLTLLLDLVLPKLLPAAIAAIEQQGYGLDVVTHFAPPAAAARGLPPGSVGVLVFEVNPLIYGYSYPLFTALLLAAPGKERDKWLKWILGLLILLPIQAWGVSFDILRTLIFLLGPEVRSALSPTELQLELVAFGYQFGYLILPAVSPVVIWLGMHRRFVSSLVPNLASEAESEPPPS